MNPKLLLLMSILSFFGCGKKAPEYPADTLTTRDGMQITITFFKHASLSIEAGGKYIYVDPVSGYADYAALPKADVVLITHSHYDHLDVAAVEAIQTPQTEILCDRTSAEAFEMNCYTMRPGSVATPRDYLKVEAVAAYNTTDGHLQFHPKEREDCGYVLTIGGSRIYIAGDTEPTPELKALKNIGQRRGAEPPARPRGRQGDPADDLLPLPLRRSRGKDRHRPPRAGVGRRNRGAHPADGVRPPGRQTAGVRAPANRSAPGALPGARKNQRSIPQKRDTPFFHPGRPGYLHSLPTILRSTMNETISPTPPKQRTDPP